MTDHYQVTVVGGGPAGLTTALYTTRLGHDTAVINRGGGRAAMMLDTHNVIGVTEDVSGNEFLETATEQVQEYGADYYQDFVSDIEETDDGYRVTAGNVEVTTDHVVLATGFSDERPDPPLPRTGKGLHYCLHCDAYMFVDEPVYVMGTGDSAAYVAMIMLNFTPEVDLLTRGDEPEWSEETGEMLDNHPIDVIHEEITGMEKRDDGWLEAFEFEDGTSREYRGGFPMYGSDYNTDLAESLGVELNDDGTIAVDDHGRTNVDGIYAVGDVTPGHNQIPTAMGEGARCGIGNHYDLRPFPRSLDEIEEQGPVTKDDIPAISGDLREHAVDHEGHPGEGQARAAAETDDD
ncbi:NAD(P)/FAD-dependent oxidoreductase [Natronomonas halophila]|uniref:NAD(P)/FAD-dependent oxidoreductase n=1 Tax=Natronomonas halophila TaxID=2747817 RepID=UPI0015B51091|nr:NAD(P)/FAD-dependent oxidoreductase [Natronomonas halophila]QLD85227.1 NAD(P)/FAD-dependent oxidoreductase [Natronomonas halophila]